MSLLPPSRAVLGITYACKIELCACAQKLRTYVGPSKAGLLKLVSLVTHSILSGSMVYGENEPKVRRPAQTQGGPDHRHKHAARFVSCSLEFVLLLSLFCFQLNLLFSGHLKHFQL